MVLIVLIPFLFVIIVVLNEPHKPNMLVIQCFETLDSYKMPNLALSGFT